jgi:heterotetrameric sarcosine oxidase gamma subunit
VILSERLVDVVEIAGASEADLTHPGGEDCVALRISPGVSLLMRPGSGRASLAAELAGRLPAGATLVDLSSAFRVFRLRGPQARWVLAKGCRIDLHDSAFHQHNVARTIIAQIPIILYHAGEGPAFDLFAPRTLAQSFIEFLTSSAADVGLAWDESGDATV